MQSETREKNVMKAKTEPTPFCPCENYNKRAKTEPTPNVPEQKKEDI